MAIDSKEKRASVLGVGRPWVRDKFPVATPDEEWRISSGNAYGGNALSPDLFVPTTPQFTINATYVSIQGHMKASGYFADVTIGEPVAFGDTTRMYGAIWTRRTRIPYLSLDSAIRVYDTRIRFYTLAFARPQEPREFTLALAVQQVASDLFGDYDLGGTIREIDIAGQFGQPVRVRWGHAPVPKDGPMYRVADMDLSLVVNNSTDFNAFPYTFPVVFS